MFDHTIASALVEASEPLSMREHARQYAERGWPVLRLLPRAKAPMTPNGVHSATTDLDIIDRWWFDVPESNIGVRPPEGMVVIDVDFRNGADLDELEPVQETLTMRSGSGGVHLWYRLPLEVKTEGKVRGSLAGAKGIDLKSASGYLVMPPSIHPNGDEYTVLIEHEIATLPDHLVDRVLRLPEAHASAQGRPGGPAWARPRGGAAALVKAVLTAEDGERNNFLHWATCRALEENADQYIFDLLADAAERNGLGPEEIEATMSSACRARANGEVAR